MYIAEDYLRWHTKFNIKTMEFGEMNLDQNPDVIKGLKLVVEDLVTQSGYSIEQLRRVPEERLLKWVQRNGYTKFLNVFYSGDPKLALRHAAGEPFAPDFVGTYEDCLNAGTQIPKGFWKVIPLSDIQRILHLAFMEREGLTPDQIDQIRNASEIQTILRRNRLGGLFQVRFNSTTSALIQMVVPFSEWTEPMLVRHFESRTWPKRFWNIENECALRHGAVLFRHWLKTHLHHLHQNGNEWLIAVDSAYLHRLGFTRVLLGVGNNLQRLANTAFPDKLIRIVDSGYADLFTMREDQLWRHWENLHRTGAGQLPYGLLTPENPRREELVSSLVFHIASEVRGWDKSMTLSRSDTELRTMLMETGLSHLAKEVSMGMIREWLNRFNQTWTEDDACRLEQAILDDWEQIRNHDRKRFSYGILTRNPDHQDRLARLLVERALYKDLRVTSTKAAEMSARRWLQFLKANSLGLLANLYSQEEIALWLRECEACAA